MANPYLAGTGISGTNTTTVTATVTSAPVTGDGLFAFMWDNAVTDIFTSVTDTQSGTWAPVVTQLTANFPNYCYRRTAGAALTTSDSVTFTITTAQALGIVLIGVPAYSSVDQTGTATNTTGNPSVPTSGATATAAEMALSVIVTSGTGGVMTWTSPWAALEAGQHGVGPWMNVGWTALAATGVATAAGTAVSSNWGGNIITVVQVSGTDTSPAYAATAAALGGGTGSWAGAANAQGTGDVTYATWTAP